MLNAVIALCFASFLQLATTNAGFDTQPNFGYGPINLSSPEEKKELCTHGEKNSFIQPQQPTCSLPLDKLVEGFGVAGTAERPYFAPTWMNHTLYRIGQQFAQENLIIISYCHYLAAIIAYNGKDVADLFSTTGKSDSYEKAILRHIANLKHTQLWYEYDILSPGSISATSIHHLRGIHSGAARMMTERLNQGRGLIDPGFYANRSENKELWSAFEADLKYSAIPSEWRHPSQSVINYKGKILQIPQLVMSLAQFIFVGLPFTMPEISGLIQATDEQWLGWNHLWAVLAYALGIDDQFNIALQPSLDQIRQHYYEIFRAFVVPGFFNLAKESKILMEIAASVAHEVLPSNYFSFSTTLLLHSILKEVLDISADNTRRLLSPTEHDMLNRWEQVKASLRANKQPLMSQMNYDFIRNYNNKAHYYYGSKYSNDATAAEQMFS